VNILSLLGLNFESVRAGFGTLIESGVFEWGDSAYLFDSGLEVWVSPQGNITGVTIWYVADISTAYHFNSFDHSSTRAQVVAQFGPPDFSDTEVVDGFTVVVYEYCFILEEHHVNFLFIEDQVAVIQIFTYDCSEFLSVFSAF